MSKIQNDSVKRGQFDFMQICILNFSDKKWNYFFRLIFVKSYRFIYYNQLLSFTLKTGTTDATTTLTKCRNFNCKWIVQFNSLLKYN